MENKGVIVILGPLSMSLKLSLISANIGVCDFLIRFLIIGMYIPRMD